jgi:hypothetical protein
VIWRRSGLVPTPLVQSVALHVLTLAGIAWLGSMAGVTLAPPKLVTVEIVTAPLLTAPPPKAVARAIAAVKHALVLNRAPKVVPTPAPPMPPPPGACARADAAPRNQARAHLALHEERNTKHRADGGHGDLQGWRRRPWPRRRHRREEWAEPGGGRAELVASRRGGHRYPDELCHPQGWLPNEACLSRVGAPRRHRGHQSPPLRDQRAGHGQQGQRRARARTCSRFSWTPSPPRSCRR